MERSRQDIRAAMTPGPAVAGCAVDFAHHGDY
jgi:hypothetical protein